MSNANWFKDAVLYTVHLRSFYDSSGNGMGDINGLIAKLDYLEDLGINCLSLLPFYPSPLRDDGYDITDYLDVHPDLGTLAHFQQLLSEAHRRGIRVVIDVMMNHTSTRHPWFQRARQAPPFSAERDFYIWSDTQDRYREASILFSDAETSNWEWDNVAGAYYWHRFYSHQADLNYDNPMVRQEIRRVISHWLQLGVDGLRLSSIAYIWREEGSSCENLPPIHDYLRDLRAYVDASFPGRLLLVDTNLWPEEAAQYFGKGDECHVNYHFPLMPRLFVALQTEDRYPILDIFDQTPEIPDNCQWALFLRNHDDLTLSMVTDEERDYLLRVLANDPGARIHKGIRRRLAPLLGNDRRKIELLNVLLFSLPGSPVIYYGDEIGMGDNIYLGDRNGMRTPMQWNDDRNAGFSVANPQRLFLPVISDPTFRYEAVNVDSQLNNPASLLWWMKLLIATRKQLQAFSRGSIRFLEPVNSKVLAFLRLQAQEQLLVVVNLSRHSQSVELDLSAYAGVQPVEIFSQNKFFPIGDEPYRFTLGPYGYYWFLLEQSETLADSMAERKIPDTEVSADWPDLFEVYGAKRIFEKKILPAYLPGCRWFAGKSRKVVALSVEQALPVWVGQSKAYLLLLQLRYTEGLPETYQLPVWFETDAARIVHFLKNEPAAVISYLKTSREEGLVVDALFEESFRRSLFGLIKSGSSLPLPVGQLRFEGGKMLAEETVEVAEVHTELLRVEQSNTSVIYDHRYFFKIYRKLDTDINPDLELVRFLSEQTSFTHSPRYGGGIELLNTQDDSSTILGLLQNKIPNKGEAWTLMLQTLARFYARVQEAGRPGDLLPPSDGFRLSAADLPEQLRILIGPEALEYAALLGRRTAEMHRALAAGAGPAFAAEPFTRHYQRSVYAAHRKLLTEKMDALQLQLGRLPAAALQEAGDVLAMRPALLESFREIYSRRVEAVKIRIHGDYHLGQVLFDGSDFYIIDFEGEPMLSISERRLKRTPFKDVAGMLRSFHYAAYAQLMLNTAYPRELMPLLEDWAEQWYRCIRGVFLEEYLQTAGDQAFIPKADEEVQLLLRIYLLEKAIYEMGYEMNARPDWIRIPLRGLLGMRPEGWL
jgi:maltose alpha-D-glucosyltransferase/alpha-amylase